MSGSEKIKANMNTGNKIFGKHIRPDSTMDRTFDVFVVQNNIVVTQKKRQRKIKKRAARADLFFANQKK